MSWVPPYRLEQSRKALMHQAGSVAAGQWLTRIGLQFWLPTREGKIRFAQRGEPVGPEEVAWFVDWGRARGVKVLLTLFNFETKWDWNLSRSAFRDHGKVLVRSLVAEVEKYRLDGVDLDFEGLGNLSADRRAFSRFVTRLSRELRARKKLLTVDSFHSPCANAPNMSWWGDWKGKVDAIHSMGYGDLCEGSTETFTPQRGKVCARGAPIFRFSWQAGWARKRGIPVAQVLLGIPGGRYEWGKGTAKKTLPEHLKDAAATGAGLCIWDVPGIAGGRQDSRWGSEESWEALRAFRENRIGGSASRR